MKANSFSGFALQAFHSSHVRVGVRPHDHLNTKDTDMEKMLLSFDIKCYQSAGDMKFSE